MEEQLRLSDLNCANSHDCPLNVGMVGVNISGDDYQPQIGQCTGFLIADDIVATNSHCIPERLKENNQSCEKFLAIKFIGYRGDGLPNIYGCKELLSFSKLKALGPDYAFFRVDPTGIKPFTISQKGIEDEERLQIAKVTPHARSEGGSLERVSCRNVLGSLLNIQAVSPWSSTGVALDCQTVEGNSGSPIINNGGEVVGIVQAYRPGRYSKHVEENFKNFNLRMPEQIKAHLIFTNLSCVSLQGISSEISQCAIAKRLGFVECLGLNGSDNMESARVAIELWRQDLPDIFMYDIVSKKKDGSVEAKPRCVKPESESRSYADYVERKGIAGLGGKRLELIYPRVYKLGSDMEVDSDLRLSSRLKFREDYRLSYRMRLDRKKNKWVGNMNSTYKDRRLGIDLTTIELPVRLEECSQEQLALGTLEKIQLLDGTVLTEDEYLSQIPVEPTSQVDCRDRNLR